MKKTRKLKIGARYDREVVNALTNREPADVLLNYGEPKQMKKPRAKKARTITSRVKYLEEQLTDLQLKYMDMEQTAWSSFMKAKWDGLKNDREQEVFKTRKIGRWKPEERGMRYYFIDDAGFIVDNSSSNGGFTDQFRWSIGNCYKTEEEAEKAKEKMLLVQEYKDFCKELNGIRHMNWENSDEAKYFLYYSHAMNGINWNVCQCARYEGTTYCLDSNLLDKALEKFGEEKLKIILGVD
jgi:hypothetical protein